MKDNDPISWTDAIEFDAAIRNKGSDGIQFPKYLHRSMVPLSEVDLTTVEDEGQINFFNEECEGMCGV